MTFNFMKWNFLKIRLRNNSGWDLIDLWIPCFDDVGCIIQYFRFLKLFYTAIKFTTHRHLRNLIWISKLIYHLKAWSMYSTWSIACKSLKIAQLHRQMGWKLNSHSFFLCLYYSKKFAPFRKFGGNLRWQEQAIKTFWRHLLNSTSHQKNVDQKPGRGKISQIENIADEYKDV